MTQPRITLTFTHEQVYLFGLFLAAMSSGLVKKLGVFPSFGVAMRDICYPDAARSISDKRKAEIFQAVVTTCREFQPED